MGKAGIIGMDCVFGDAGDLEVFARLVYVGTPLPLGAPQMSPESGTSTPGGLALLVKRLLGARPSGMSDGPAPQIGAIVCATEASVDAATMAATLSFYGTPGPSEGFDLGRIAEALELAQAWLTQGAADLVLLASHDQVGTCGIVIAPAQAVSPARIYALVESVTVGVTEQGSALYRRGLAEAGATPAEVGLLQVSDWPPSAELAAGYMTASEDLTCAVGTTPVRPDPQGGRPPGEGAVSPLWNVIKAALCLHRRVIPPTGLYSLPVTESAEAGVPIRGSSGWQDTPFYIVPEARPWFAGNGRRIASIVREADVAWQIVLSEPAPSREIGTSGRMAIRPGAAGEPSVLLPIAGEDKGQILSRMDALRRSLEGGASLPSVVEAAYERYAAEAEAPYALALVGRRSGRSELKDAILKEMAFAAEGVEGADRQEWQTPGGSVFTAHPLGSQGVAFVYPGAFNSYIGLGKDLFQHFPDLHERLSGLVSDLGRAVADRHIYPRSRTRLTEKDLAGQAGATYRRPAGADRVGHGLCRCSHARHVRGIRGAATGGAGLQSGRNEYALGGSRMAGR